MRIDRREFLQRGAAATAAVVAPALLPRIKAAAEPLEPKPMLLRTIPGSGESIPAIGMGTWQTFDADPTDRQALAPLAEVLRIFFDGGGRVIDSSPMYGKAEDVTGLLSERLGINDQLFLATKVWTEGQESGVAQMTRSLKRLKRNTLELMQIHNLVDWPTQLRTLRDWKERGTFRYIGITHFAPARFDELERILRRERLDFVQLPYSMAQRTAEQRLLPAAQETATAVLVMRPLEGGALFRRAGEKPLPQFVQEFASSWAQAFLKFILAHEAVTCVLPATSKPHHMSDNIQAGYGRLPDPRERARLAAALGLE